MSEKNKSTLIVFSGDLDKAIASFILATGAAAIGKEVTMFFTFWGLNILRKDQYVKTKKSFMDRIFSAMLPRGPEKLGISKMNYMGLGAKMMRYVMKQKNIMTLPQLIEGAQDLGIRLVACSMSMEVMGIKEEELIDGVEFAGVASYMADADDSNINLFI